MTEQELMGALMDAIREIQTVSGEPEPQLTEETKPQIDLPGFESVRCVEVETVLSEKLGCEVDFGAVSGPADLRQLTLKEVVTQLLPRIKGAT